MAVAKAEKSLGQMPCAQGAADVNATGAGARPKRMSRHHSNFAHRLVRARSVEEVAAIQQEFLPAAAAHNLAEQGKNLGEMMGRAGQGGGRRVERRLGSAKPDRARSMAASMPLCVAIFLLQCTTIVSYMAAMTRRFSKWRS